MSDASLTQKFSHRATPNGRYIHHFPSLPNRLSFVSPNASHLPQLHLSGPDFHPTSVAKQHGLTHLRRDRVLLVAMSHGRSGEITRDGFTYSYGRFYAQPGLVERVRDSSLRTMFLPSSLPKDGKH